MIHNQRLYNNTEWVRPADWLPIDHLVTNGEEKIVGLYAIFPSTETYFHNKVAFTNRGITSVDWGDGNVESFGDGVTAEHIYDYDNIPNSTICSRGYKQVIITITSPYNLYSVLMSSVHSTNINTISDTSNWLDVKICMVGLSLFRMNISGTKIVYPVLLEKVKMYQTTNALSVFSTAFQNCSNLAYCDLNGLNTENVTTMAYAFANCASLKTLLISNWNTGNVTDMNGMFYNTVIDNINLSNFSTNIGKEVSIFNMFTLSVVDKIILGALRINTSASQLFYVCSAKEIDVSRVVSFKTTSMANAFDGSSQYGSRLKSFDFSKIDATLITNMSAALNVARLIEECIFTNGYFTNCSTFTTFVTLTANFGTLRKLRLPKCSVSLNISNQQITGTDMNLLFGDLSDLNGAVGSTTVVSYGTGYAVGDLITFNAGNNDAVLLVTGISTGGQVTLARWYNSMGTGYSIQNNVTSTSPNGTGYIVNITALKTTQTITITGTPAATDPLTNRTIATAKNWTVVG